MESTSVVARRLPALEAEVLAYAGLAFSSLGWASAFIAGKFVLAEMTPLATAAARYVIAALVLLPFALRQLSVTRLTVPVLRRTALPVAVMVMCGGVVYPWVFLAALARTSATNTALLVALNPVFTILLAPLVGETLTRRRAVGVTFALLGAATVITKGDVRHLTELSFNAGDLLALLAATIWATFNLSSRSAMLHITPAVANGFVFCAGGLALSALSAGEHPLVQLASASPAAIVGLLVLAIVSSVLAGHCFLTGVRILGVSRAVVFVYFVPVLTAVLSAIVLHERFYIAQAIGGAAVLLGVYWSTSARPAPAPFETAPEQAGERRRVLT